MASLNKNQARRGTTTVEAAIVFPFLVLLTFALIEYGWLFLNVQQTTNAARHGARLAVTPDATAAEIQNAISELLTRAGLAGSGFAVSITPSDFEDVPVGQAIKVEVTVPYEDFRISSLPLPLPATLRASVSMAKEGP